MKLQKLLSLTRKAVDEFKLIDPCDKIAVGVSEKTVCPCCMPYG